MSARPIDLKTALPKTQQIARLQQQQKNLHKNDLHNHVVKTNNQVEKRLKKVINSEKTNYKRINREKQKKENSKQNQQQGNKDTKENTDKKIDKQKQNHILGNNIDIKI